MKIVRIRSYSGLHFSAFGLSTERYGVTIRIQPELTIRIQPEFGKILARITPNTTSFHAMNVLKNFSSYPLTRNISLIYCNSHKDTSLKIHTLTLDVFLQHILHELTIAEIRSKYKQLCC